MKDLTLERKRCLELSGIIREGRPNMSFDMEVFCDSNKLKCNTAACIAGWAVATYDLHAWEKWMGTLFVEARGKQLLGLSHHDARALFFLEGEEGENIRDIRGITPEIAAATLAHYAMTGEVDWFIHD